MKDLVIVESPTKARTIARFLGDEYEIKYSMGHLLDLPKSKLGIEIDADFAPQYEVIADKKKIISELRTSAKGAKKIILATDPDREGEAIASNIKDILAKDQKAKSKEQRFSRIVFHEITEGAIKEAFNQPREVDTNLVDAQTARRVLDRLVGYQLSPLLWQRVRRGLSAGRVQSIALRLIVEREREIGKFEKLPYFTIHADFKKGDSEPVEFDLFEIENKKIEKQESFNLYDGVYKTTKTILDSQELADLHIAAIKQEAFTVSDVSEKQSKRSPYAPFTTSTLQQDASRRFGLSGKMTMSIAQKLYEEGYITYHRTDSTTLSKAAVEKMREYIQKKYGEKYVPVKPRIYATKQKSAQEAHEAIRPTKMSVDFETVEKDLGKNYGKLYDLIWKRAVSSQMADALLESTTVYVTGGKYRFKANGSVLVFDGFLKLNPQALQDKKLPKFIAGEKLQITKLRADFHETTPPPRYNDASIIGTLEEKGIGRPSTYASIISTIVDRMYVERSERRFIPTPVGTAVNDFLVKNFSTIDDIPFTAQMEENLDEVARGDKKWVTMMKEFYEPFSKKLLEAKNSERVKIEVETTDEQCPECKSANLVVRTGKFGKFLSCARFPDCKFSKPLVEETDVLCPQDGGKVIVKKTRKGRKFYGCSNYPNCTFAAWKLEDIKK